MRIIFLTAFALFAFAANQLIFGQTIENSYDIGIQIPAGNSVVYYVPISGVPTNATISGVEAKFEYIAYNGVEDFLSVRFNRESDPGSSGGVVLVAQGNLPPRNPGTFGYISFSNWNGQSVNTDYYFRFTVASGAPYNPTIIRIWTKVNYNIPPPTPTLVRPLSGTQVYSETPTFQWQTVPNQTDFQVVVYNSSIGTEPYIVINHPETSSSNVYTVSQTQALPAGDYWWKLAVATASGTSPYTNLINFTVNSPTPNFPVNTTVSTPTPTFTWGVVPNQSYYRVAIYDDPSGTDSYMVRNYPGTGPSNSWTCDINLPDGQYWWKVNAAVSTESGNSPYCNLQSFAVQSTQLDLISPTYNQNINGGNILLQWSDVGADSYYVYVDNNIIPGPPGIYSSPEIYGSKVTSNQHSIPEYFLEGDQTFYWKIVAFLPGNSILESSVGLFNYYPYKLPDPYWVPLYRLFKSSDHDHFYCTSDIQRAAADTAGYNEEGVEGFISAKPFNVPDMKKIFRLYSGTKKAHFFTTDGNEKDIKIQEGFTYEGIIGFTNGSQQIDQVPMYQLHKDFTGNNIDYFYTLSWAERKNAEDNLGYSYDGIKWYSPQNNGQLTQALGLGQVLTALGINASTGNFSSPVIRSFNITGKGIPLIFEHFYNSFSTTSHTERQPLGPGWSHTYNSYVSVSDPNANSTLMSVVWPDGNTHYYYKSGTSYNCITQGVYDEIEVLNFPLHFKIKKKDQTVYEFETPAGATWGTTALLKSITDRNNNLINLNYQQYILPDNSKIFRLINVTDASSRSINFSYYSTYGKEQLIQSISDPIGRVINFLYDTNGNLSRFTDAEGKYYNIEYDTNWEQDHLLKKFIFPKGNFIENTYDSTTIYGSNVKYVKNQVNSSSSSTFQIQFDKNPSSSTVSSTVTDPGSQIWQYTSSPNAQVTQIYNQGQQFAVSFERLDANNPALPTKVTDGRNYSTSYVYDLRGNATSISQPEGATHNYTYNQMNDVTRYTNPRNVDFDYTYDGNGNLSSIISPSGTISLTYLPGGLVQTIQNQLNKTTTFSYNQFGNIQSVLDPLNYTSNYIYDGVSRLQSVTNPKSQTTSYTYDKNDLLKTLNDPSGTTQYSYDNNRNLVSIINAKGQVTNLSYDPTSDWLTGIRNNAGNQTTYEYYFNGLISSKTDPMSNTTNYYYDLAGRVSNIISPTRTATMIYDKNNNMEGLTDNAKNMYFTYDGLNRLKTYTDYYSNQISYTYDPAGNITDILYPTNKNVHYTYDPDNRLSSVSDWNNKTTYYSYYADGSLHQITYPSPNNIVTTYTYDNASRITGITTTGPGGTISEYNFTLDELGNHTQETVLQPLSPVPDLTSQGISYSYDLVNRIQSAGSNNYSFNSNGNMISRIKDGVTTTFQFNEENNLVGINNSQTTFLYDVFGNRREANRNGQIRKYVLDINGPMSQVLVETDVNNNPVNYYVYGLGLIERIKADGTTTHFYHGDFRGSTIALTDANGNVTHKYSYDAFGNLLDDVEQDYNPFKYVGAYGVMEENNGLQFMRARYYDPEIGRFISEDPVWDVNLYSYADNNSISLSDPAGQKPQKAGILFLSLNKFMDISEAYSKYLTQVAKVNNINKVDFLSLGKAQKYSKFGNAIAKYSQIQFITYAFIFSVEKTYAGIVGLTPGKDYDEILSAKEVLEVSPIGLLFDFVELWKIEKEAYRSFKGLIGR